MNNYFPKTKPNLSYTITDAQKDIKALQGEVFGHGIGHPSTQTLIDHIDEQQREIEYLRDTINANALAVQALLGMGQKIVKEYNEINAILNAK